MALIRKTMRVGGRETCVGLEPPFWACLAELAAERRVSLAALMGQVAAARPAGDSLASALRDLVARIGAAGLGEHRRHKKPAPARQAP